MELIDKRKAEIAAMPRKELNAHALLCEQEQVEYEKEIAKLKEERELWENRAEDAKNDRDTFAREMHEYRRSARKAEQERDALLEGLKKIAEQTEDEITAGYAHSIIAKIESTTK